MSARTTPRRRTAVFATAALATVVTGALVACGNSTASAADAPAASSRPSATATAGSSLHMIANNGHKLAFHVTPGHLPAIVLDAGGGEDSSQWQKIAPALARKTGSEIITYDRAGIGKSDEVVGAWNAENAASDLEAGLTKLGATHDVVLVSHSQAGEVATYFAKKHPKWLSGAVLLDASLPDFYTDSETARIEAANQAQVAQLDGQVSTKPIRQLLATADNYGPMHHAYQQISWPKSVPATVIASSTTPFDTPEDAQLWRNAQTRFAKAAANRTYTVAKGSSHEIPTDRPDVVIKAAAAMAKAHG
ncbi:alpha/beta fold hydrolase [Streptomyces sp. NBC_01089]|uniref:alpha/beta fold hydrolase n=1 Tax=Streptomyces sp. NBC_01089 TaxID=2903747 RepID=UPI00386B3063|nr:alpha/beta hydrolase [Streptomyces sp. NBC_01089]